MKIRYLLALARRDLQRKAVEPLGYWLVSHLPHGLLMRAYIYVGTATIRGDETVPDARFTELLRRWERRELAPHARAADRFGVRRV